MLKISKQFNKTNSVEHQLKYNEIIINYNTPG
jgi:hypothetical protein